MIPVAYCRGRKGQAVVESALIMPWLALLVVAIMQFGLVMNHYLIVVSAAREGARTAALGGDDAGVRGAVLAAVPVGGMDTGRLTITVEPAQRLRGNAVTVTVSYPLTIIAGMMQSYFQSVDILASSTMRME